MTQQRWKSPVIYIAIVSQIIAILLASGTIAPDLAETIKVTITSVLQILVLLGILNNPVSKSTY